MMIQKVMAGTYGCPKHHFGHDDRRCSCRFEYQFAGKPFLEGWTDKAASELSTVLGFKYGGHSMAAVDAAIEEWQS